MSSTREHVKHLPYWLITCSVLVGLTLPTLLQDGMFMDAVLYTSVAHNLSQGLGSFWLPIFDEYNIVGFHTFHEQPPLGFGIQSFFFRFFGSSMYVERAYVLVTLCLNALLIRVLWKEVFKHYHDLQKMSWLPVLLWITIPVCFWSYSNNMLENTLSLFILSASILMYKTVRRKSLRVGAWVLSACFVFLGFLVKGFPAFFITCIPFFYCIVLKKITVSRTVKITTAMLFTYLFIAVVLFLMPDAKHGLSIYIFKRAFKRILENPSVVHRYFILIRLFTELIPVFLFTGLAFLLSYWKKLDLIKTKHLRKAIFFLCVGLAGSLPLMLTMVQNGFYFVPALPYFAMGFAILTAPILLHYIQHWHSHTQTYKVFKIVGTVLLTSAFIFSFAQIGKTCRDKELLQDVYAISKALPERSTINASSDAHNYSELMCYLMRTRMISMQGNSESQYLIAGKNSPVDSLYTPMKVNEKTTLFNLYEKK